MGRVYQQGTSPRSAVERGLLRRSARLFDDAQRRLATLSLRRRWTTAPRSRKYSIPFPARMAELVDAPDLGSGFERSGGSSPPPRTQARLLASSALGASSFAAVRIGPGAIWALPIIGSAATS